MDSLYPNLSATMENRGVSIRNLAEIIGLSEEVVRLKLRGTQDWGLSEAVAICHYFDHPDLRTLFVRKLR